MSKNRLLDVCAISIPVISGIVFIGLFSMARPDETNVLNTSEYEIINATMVCGMCGNRDFVCNMELVSVDEVYYHHKCNPYWKCECGNGWVMKKRNVESVGIPSWGGTFAAATNHVFTADEIKAMTNEK